MVSSAQIEIYPSSAFVPADSVVLIVEGTTRFHTTSNLDRSLTLESILSDLHGLYWTKSLTSNLFHTMTCQLMKLTHKHNKEQRKSSSLKYLLDLVSNWPNSQIPYPTMLRSEQKYVHLCSEWSIVGYGTSAFWDLWNWSILCHRIVSAGCLHCIE